jgi:hypothetical protein
MRPGTARAEDAGDGLGRLMRMVLHSSPGPFTVVRTAARRHRVTAGPSSRFVASFTRPADADLFITIGPALRNLVVAVSEIRGYHRDDGRAHCAECGDNHPCRTRRMLDQVAAGGGADHSAARHRPNGWAG